MQRGNGQDGGQDARARELNANGSRSLASADANISISDGKGVSKYKGLVDGIGLLTMGGMGDPLN